MRNYGLLAIALLSFVLVGCASFHSNISKLSPGMDEEVARDTIGVNPRRVTTLNDETVWLFQDGYMVFNDHKLSHYGLARKHKAFSFLADANSARNPPPGEKVVLIPGSKTVSLVDLETQQYFHQIAVMLRQKGFKVVDNMKAADVVVTVNFGISEPNKEIVSEPLYGLISSGSTTVHNATANVYGYGGYATANVSGTSSTGPTYGYLGMRQRTVVTFTRWLSLNAFDLVEFRRSKKERQLWKATLASTGAMGDLRAVFPYLAIGISEFVGIDSKEQISWQVFDNDAKLAWFEDEESESSRLPASE